MHKSQYKIPMNRAAYSDRTALLMAKLSALAYEKYESEVSIEAYMPKIVEAIKSDKSDNKVKSLLEEFKTTGQSEPTNLRSELSALGFDLIKSISIKDTQCFIACHGVLNEPGSYVVLSFRGTESFKDAMVDAKAMLEKLPDGGRVHTGFLKAYRLVEKEILSSLVPYKDMPLYITGHSLGGGLSILATRFLSDDNLAATYTFGCPRVGDQKFLDYIYTPVYRIVNSSDIVTRVPSGYGFTLVISFI